MDLLNSVKHGLRTTRENWTPARSTSAFLEEGVLTPNEFVLAGDLLVARCPTWEWASGDPAARKAHLPDSKQYLVTRRVPCRCRASSLLGAFATTHVDVGGDVGGEGGDGWLEAHAVGAAGGAEEAKGFDDDFGDDGFESIEADGSVAAPAPPPPTPPPPAAEADDADDDYADLETFEEDNIVAPDGDALDSGAMAAAAAVASSSAEDNVLRTRTYDLSITYDKYYQTPRFWLFGCVKRARCWCCRCCRCCWC